MSIPNFMSIPQEVLMNKSLVIFINKFLYRVGRIVGKGSSLPGQVAMKLYPNILSEIELPENIIMVTGSNGKTSTTELIYNVLSNNGFNVGCNLEGSNQTEGVATMILNNCNSKGVVTKDALVIESDERYLRHTLKFFKPKYLVITNLYRDQLTRNGHPEYIFDVIKEAGLEDIKLVLNADDPLSSLFGINRDDVTYFGINKTAIAAKENDGIYDDGIYCPNCKTKLLYEYHTFAHLGRFQCENCYHFRQLPKYAITDIDLQTGVVKINGTNELKLSMRSLYMAYNFLSAFAVGSLMGVEDKKIIETLSEYVIKNDRIQEFEIGEHKGMLLTSKHENSIAYDQAISYIVKENKPCTVVIIVDQISRKYFTSETSWIWDINFEKLNADCVKKVVLVGKYVHDLISRFTYTECDMSKVSSFISLDEMMKYLKGNAVGDIYVATCFTDRDKFISRV